MTYEEYKSQWQKKTTKQIQHELESWRKYFARYDGSYHSTAGCPEGQITEGDKVTALKEILKERES